MEARAGRPTAGVMACGDSGNDAELFVVEGGRGLLACCRPACVVAELLPALLQCCSLRGCWRLRLSCSPLPSLASSRSCPDAPQAYTAAWWPTLTRSCGTGWRQTCEAVSWSLAAGGEEERAGCWAGTAAPVTGPAEDAGTCRWLAGLLAGHLAQEAAAPSAAARAASRHDRIFRATRDGPGGIVEALHHFRSGRWAGPGRAGCKLPCCALFCSVPAPPAPSLRTACRQAAGCRL